MPIASPSTTEGTGMQFKMDGHTTNACLEVGDKELTTILEWQRSFLLNKKVIMSNHADHTSASIGVTGKWAKLRGALNPMKI